MTDTDVDWEAILEAHDLLYGEEERQIEERRQQEREDYEAECTESCGNCDAPITPEEYKQGGGYCSYCNDRHE